MKKYLIVIEQTDGGYSGYSPDLPGCVSTGKTREETECNMREAIQFHGAIGYTWECDLQLFMKKAWALIPAWGSVSFHRRRVADAVLGPR